VNGAAREPVVGVLHPGEMGASVAGALVAQGRRVVWASAGRSDDTRRRATAGGLVDVGTLESLIGEADLVVSICPPDAALGLARSVAEAGFTGLYLDANAVAP
jgi:prephenate dehydrogenase